MASEQHRQNMTLLIDALRLHLADRQDVYVAGNMALYFNELQVRKNDFLGPDVFVVLDTVNRPRRSWVVWQEGQTPDVVIELLSASTEDNDRGKKKQTYARSLHVPEYYLYDPLDGRFEGFRLQGREYVPVEPEADGGITSAQLGLRLIPHDEVFLHQPARFLRWATLDGALLPTPAEEAARQAARADALAARLRALGIEPE